MNCKRNKTRYEWTPPNENIKHKTYCTVPNLLRFMKNYIEIKWTHPNSINCKKKKKKRYEWILPHKKTKTQNILDSSKYIEIYKKSN